MRAVACISWLLLSALIAGVCGCLPPRPAPPLPGVTLQPGRYLEAFYRDPEFVPERNAFLLEPFTVEVGLGISADTFQNMFQEELRKAWEANGLTLKALEDACRVSGAVHRVSFSGSVYRFLLGKISADLSVSGAITQGEKTRFAFQDRIHITTPVKPGRAAPKETELLLRQAIQEFAAHLLNELLLQGLPPAEG
ncbi:MAG: hypothetical protein FJ134_04520 [Deltaproteobacteria bacterium]|nr:hypothetical protein [Deltaproteobacteria bacterium]